MVFGNINDLKSYEFLEDKVKECFAYAKSHDLMAMEKGSHLIDGERLFVNIVEYETTTPDKRFWEAHRKYLDLHLLLNGPEQIDLNFIRNLTQKDYVEKDDFLPLEGRPNSMAVLESGDFLLCYPKDGHRTAIAPGAPTLIKKAIFKILI